MSWRATSRTLRILKQVRGVKRKPPEPIKEWKIKKGDLVQVLAGRDKGKQGKVVLLDRKFNRLFVEGMNTHMVRVTAGDFKGRVQREAPLHYSNVALVDPEDGEPCRIKYMYTEDGNKVRVSTRSGRIIPNPVIKKDVTKLARPDGVMDTDSKLAARVTFVPSLVSFEDEMAEKFGHLAISDVPKGAAGSKTGTLDSQTS